jgi:NTP pyrophosphatase (non-canonical NTP hydrolase)
MNELDAITQRIRTFRDLRDWGKFHNPKNLACSISIESAELLEHFQWKTPEESTAYAASKCDALSEEIADVGIYLIALADNLGIDLLRAIERKLAINERKYPVEKAKGSARKYTEL